jgi:hypothetical protein
MSEDRESTYFDSDLNPDTKTDKAEDLSAQSRLSASRFSRREVLIGGVSTALAGSAAAADQKSYLDVTYEDGTRRGLVLAWVEKPSNGPNQTFEWLLRASTFTDPDLSGGAGRFVLRRTPYGWRANIARCNLPGGYQFGLQMDVRWDPGYDPGKASSAKPSLSITVFRPGKQIPLSVVDLVAFLKASPDGVDEIAGNIDESETVALAQLLFGEAFDVATASEINLAFHHGNYWILRAGKRLLNNAEETSAQKQSRFAALPGEDVSLRFREVFFTVFSGRSGGNEAFQLDATAKEKEDVRALFAGDGAPPSPDGSLSDSTQTVQTAGAAPAIGTAAGQTPAVRPKLGDRAAQQSDVGTAGQLGIEASSSTVRILYGLVKHNIAAYKQIEKTPLDVWKGTLALGSGPAKERATLELKDDSDPSFLGWRNSGDQNPVFALRTRMTLGVWREPGVVASRFEKLAGRLWRARDDDKAVRIIAALTPMTRPMEIDTRFGPFTVAPLPALAARPGVSASVPSIRVGGTGTKNKRLLNHFAAPLALERSAINVTSARLTELIRNRAVPPKAAQVAVEHAILPFSQLVFRESECLFRVNKLPLRHVWTGTPAPSTDPPQAEAIVHIGSIAGLPYPVQISLSRATLMVRRPADHLALTYRFQDLILERSDDGWIVTPDRRLADFVPNGQPITDPNVDPICSDAKPTANEPTRYQNRSDSRPLLVVEFPPQHVAERAFFRQLLADPFLPVPPAGHEPSDDDAEILRTGKAKDRLARRLAISNSQQSSASDDYKKFQARFPGAVDVANEANPRATIPDDQRIYLGPAFLDVQSARVARLLGRQIEAEALVAHPRQNTADERARVMRGVPEVVIQQTVIDDLRKRLLTNVDPSEGWPEANGSGQVPGLSLVKKYLDAREDIRKRNDYSYAAFTAYYAKDAHTRASAPGLTSDQQAAITKYGDSLPTPFYGRRSAVAQVEILAKTSEDNAMLAAQAIAATVAAFDLQNQRDEDFEIPAEARVSGGSRLVFRIPADDFEGGRPDNRQDAPAGSFPFTIEALTNWGAFDLAVVRRAEKVFEPLAGWMPKDSSDQIADGRLPPRWAQQETRDEAAKLLHQGITRGDSWAVRHDEQRQLNGVSGCPVPLARLGAVTAAQRMAEVVANVRAPSPYETSIEIPFRLMMSPAQDACWRTPLQLPAEVLLTPIGSLPVPLWFAQLDEAPGGSSLRAIWSPDFRPEALLERDLGGPPHGPWAPWAMARDVTSNYPYSTAEPVYTLPNQTYSCDPKPAQQPDCEAPEKFRTALDAADRHELVGLTSLYGLPARGRRNKDGTLADGSQINPPAGFKVRHAALESLQQEPADDYSALYRPQPLGASELTLTALGGSFDADTNFVPPASARIVSNAPWFKDVRGPGEPLFDAFSIERWQQQTRLGRDIRVEVVYKGFLFPLGHRCSLVKLTERRFVVGPNGMASGPVAFLVQRLFLRIGTPLKSYPTTGQPNGGRSWPTQQVEILTRVTPDLLDPADATPSTHPDKVEEALNGRIFLRLTANDPLLPGLVFWPRVRAREGGEVNFELQIDGRGARTRMPLIFVDNTAANDANTLAALTDWYNGLDTDAQGKVAPNARRILQLGGDKRRYAAEKEPDGTSFETQFWTLGAEGREASLPEIIDDDRRINFHNTNVELGSFDFGALLQGVDQPPFFPVMQRASVHIGQVDRMVGQSTAQISVAFDDEYRAFGFPKDDVLSAPPSSGKRAALAKTDVYLDFMPSVSLDPGRSGDRIGGGVRPNTILVGMSRSRGPIGNHSAARAPMLAGRPVPSSTGLDAPSPGTFFSGAKLLGIVDLQDALKFILQGISGTPQFTEVTQYSSALLADAGEDVGTAVAKVRDQLLVPMREALRTLAQQFFLGVKLGQTFDEEVALERIELLYPDVGRAYRELAAALDTAIGDSANVGDVDALFGYFAVIYGAGRRFLAAIDRVANDPLAPVHEALRDAFNNSIQTVTNAVNGVIGPIQAPLLKTIADFENMLRGAFYDAFFVNDNFAVWRHLLFTLPGVHSVPGLPANVAVQLDDTVKTALSDAARESRFLETLVANGPDAAAAALGPVLKAKLIASIAGATDPLKTALKAAVDDWVLAADADAQRIQGMIYQTALQKIQILFAAVQALAVQTVKSPNIGSILGALEDVLDKMFDTVDLLSEFSFAQISAICGQFSTLTKTLLQEVIPPSASLDNIEPVRDAMVQAFANAATDLAAFGLDAAANDIRDSLLEKINALIKVRDAFKRASDSAVQLASDICSSAQLDRAALDALAVMRRIRGVLVLELNEFAIMLVDPTTSGAGGKLQALMASIPGSANAARISLARAAASAALVTAALCELTRDGTSLQGITSSTSNPLPRTRALLDSLRGPLPDGSLKTELGNIIGVIDGAQASLRQARQTVDDLIGRIRTKAGTIPTAALPQYLMELLTIVSVVPTTIEDIRTNIVENLEQQVLTQIGTFLVQSLPYLQTMISTTLGLLSPLITVLRDAQGLLVTERDKLWTSLGGSASDLPPVLGGDLNDITLKKIAALLLVSRQDRLGLNYSGVAPDNDYLATEKKEFDDLVALFASADPARFDNQILQELKLLVADWIQSRGSAQELARQISDAAAAVLSGDLKRIVDLEGVRRRIEEKLLALVPAKIVLDYNMHCELQGAGPFQPEPGSEITLSAGAVYNLLEPSTPPQFTATCEIDAFNINILDVVTLLFSGARFVNASGKGSDFNVSYKDFQLGPMAAFLKPLEDLMNPGASGPYVKPSDDFPGIEAGYSLDLGIISIGVMSFINVSINAACILPFNNKSATFMVSIGREDRPVMLSCLPYIGGGFLVLYADAKKMIGFAASFEFGGGGAFAFGPLSGQGRITTGIYLRKMSDAGVEIDGFFYAGGEAHIACFAISATLVVRMSQLAGGTMQGSAVFTFSFSIGFAHIRYSVGVQRQMGKGFSGSHSAGVLQTLEGPGTVINLLPNGGAPAAIVTSLSIAQQEDWLRYQNYFDGDIYGFPV